MTLQLWDLKDPFEFWILNFEAAFDTIKILKSHKLSIQLLPKTR